MASNTPGVPHLQGAASQCKMHLTQGLQGAPCTSHRPSAVVTHPSATCLLIAASAAGWLTLHSASSRSTTACVGRIPT
jgi:hypothetical protein